MKFVYLTSVYKDYIKAFYGKHPLLAKMPYSEQIQQILIDGFGWNGAWESALEPLGYAVETIVCNIKPLQQMWAKERGISWTRFNWAKEIPLQQIKESEAEVVLVDVGAGIDNHWLKKLREMCPSVCLVLGYSCTPSFNVRTLQSYDAVLTCTKGFASHFTREGCRAFYMRHAFNTKVLDYLPGETSNSQGISFVGGIIRGEGYHLERERMLEALSREFTLRIYSPQYNLSFVSDFINSSIKRGAFICVKLLEKCGVNHATCANLPLIGRAASWKTMPKSQISKSLRPYLQPAVFGLEMYQTLKSSAVTINIHGEIAGNEAANSRLFEATGVGVCLLTDWKGNLHELFEIDKEIVAFQSVDECIEKARWLLKHKQEREQIAKAGQARTLRDHTFTNRALELDEIIRGLLAKTSACSRN